jgi:hypothetical protein
MIAAPVNCRGSVGADRGKGDRSVSTLPWPKAGTGKKTEQEVTLKSPGKVLMVVFIGGLLVMSSGCESTPKHSGFLGPYYNNLQPGPKGGANGRWVKPGIDFSRYNRFIIDRVAFYYAEDSGDKSIHTEEVKELTDAFTQEIVSALKDKYSIVSEPGPGVARFRIALTNVKKDTPPIGDTITAMPRERRMNVMRNVSLSTWGGSGRATGEMMMIDSSTSEVIAVAMVEREAGLTDSGAGDAFRYWAGRIRGFIDDSRASKQ